MQSRNLAGSITLALLLGAAPASLALPVQETAPSQELSLETRRGKIRSVGEESFVMMVDGEALTVTISEDTSYLLDGEEARKDQVLKADQQVSVEIEDGVATQVSARSSS